MSRSSQASEEPAIRAALRERAPTVLGQAPELLVHVPGRIDLLGSHTDYNDLPVLACALPQAVYAAALRIDGPRVEAHNCDAKHASAAFPISRAIPASPIGDWANYLKAGVQGAVLHHQPRGAALRGWRAVFASDLPAGAGLSSSSALVVAAALLTETVNGWRAAPAEQAAYLARAEHYVGTQGGGLDHATILCSEPGRVLRIDFAPLAIRAIPFPPELALVICHCGREAAKTAAARAHYNRRVIECRIGAARLGHALALAGPSEITGSTLTLGALLRRAGMSARAAAATWPALLQDGIRSLPDIARALGCTAGELASSPLLRAGGGLFDIPADGLHPARRVAHVLTEAARVEAAEAAVAAGDAPALGEAMTGSYRSARDRYEISCPELDALIARGLGTGALGARIAGAGFGGCALFALETERLDRWLQQMAQPPDPFGPCWPVRPAAPAAVGEAV